MPTETPGKRLRGALHARKLRLRSKLPRSHSDSTPVDALSVHFIRLFLPVLCLWDIILISREDFVLFVCQETLFTG